jgi:hypothetical protein
MVTYVYNQFVYIYSMSILFNFTDSQLFNSNIEIISSLFFANINRENALLCMTPTENQKSLNGHETYT